MRHLYVFFGSLLLFFIHGYTIAENITFDKCVNAGEITLDKAIFYDAIQRGSVLQDTVQQDSLGIQDSTVYYNPDPTKSFLGNDSVKVSQLENLQNLTLNQMLKGVTAGVYIQESSGEPGTVKQNSLIRGLSFPVLGPKDFHKNSPLVILNGVQLINDPSMIYDIQDYEVQPLGSATSLSSLFDIDNIESIKVLKDYSTAAIYGPRAANGVIYITTKNAKAGQRKLALNGYSGIAVPNSVTTINGDFLKEFRNPFYAKYSPSSSLPYYLSDSSNVNYYGPSNWTDLYYEPTPIYSLNGSLDGGSERSNFRLFLGHTSNSAASDHARLQRFQGAFYINMIPTKWVTISAMLHMNRLARDRNTSLAERLSEMRYFPDLSTPIAPSKDVYGLYLNEYERSIDNNQVNSLIGSLNINFMILKNLNFSTRLSMDYNENKRDLFYRSPLMIVNNYASNYFGYNDRLAFDNAINYDYKISDKQHLLVEGGLNYHLDNHRYNYNVGYRGQNDAIMVNVVEGNKDKSEYLKAVGFIPYYYSDRLQHKLASLYGKVTYSGEDQWKVGLLYRRDGSSAAQVDSRWFNSYSIDGEYNLNYHLNTDILDHLKVFGSWGRLGNLPFEDRGAAGPQYASGLGWEGNRSVFTFNGFGTIARPYSSGWIGYDLPWTYTDLFNVGLDASLSNRLILRLDYYNRTTKDMIFNIPTVAESGYRYEVAHGMEVQNRGVDLSAAYSLDRGAFKWSSSFNIAYNTNELLALPNGLNDIVVGNRKLAVGSRIDHYWVLRNEGIYAHDLDVPVRSSDYKIMTYNGTAMKGGDPRWVDTDGNFDINNNDRQLLGNIVPKYIGGFYNQLSYQKIDLSFHLYFNLGREILNEQASRYFDFVNQEEINSIHTVKDITYWEKNFEEDNYPMYNPWSSVSPYQVDQDMFLEDGSFLKLRNLSLGYNLTDVMNGKSQRFNRFYVYVTASNLFTITNYSGRDPELVNYYGYDTGLGLRMPRTYSLGVKLDF